MPKRLYSFRFDDVDVSSWQRCAEKSGLTLSEWIRRRCNGEGHLIAEELKHATAGTAPPIKQYQDFRGTEALKEEPKIDPRLSCEHGAAFGLCRYGCTKKKAAKK